ncbi:MAG: KUP/HAK/KT family potassium transporter [Caulobacteraceae bacterium]|nr:KUP/HAK/KT family potassium transporter [Caulobacteraceae bacterium]
MAKDDAGSRAASIRDDAAGPRPIAAIAALGVVFGDLGTSPLYTLQTVVEAAGGHFTQQSALGILSLIFWTLIITVSVKYCLFVMRADNNGEGGILALMSLVGANALQGRTIVLTVMGLLGAGLIYGDGVITPAISVLSALEGVNVVTSSLKPFIMPLAVVILAALFAAQRFGTARIGGAFGPVMLIWFIVIAALGLSGIVSAPVVLTAVNPWLALRFLLHSGAAGPLILGGVFLCITGGEALYADMGHFGRGPIRLSWYGIVLPALLISYAGQTALLLRLGHVQGNPFFQLAPHWMVYPLVVLSTIATIIASQAIITGSFSMTRQAMQLGWLPGVHIRQTSDRVYGQIYVPVVNSLMMIATLAITVAFRSSDRLAGAYGAAVSTTMLLTTFLLFAAMRRVWKWPLPLVLSVGGVFLVVDAAFFGANLLKVVDGGWLPLTLGFLMFGLMATWRTGIDAVRARSVRVAISVSEFQRLMKTTPRVPGTAVFLTRQNEGVPSIVSDHVKFVGALQEHVLALTVIFEPRPRVPEAERFTVVPLCDGLCHVTIRFGFVEVPNVQQTLNRIKDFSPGVDIDNAFFFGTRDMVKRRPQDSRLPAWQLPIFAFLFRNAVKTFDRFSLPATNVIEISREVEV